MTTKVKCSLCQLTEDTHRELEAANRVAHRFTTEDGFMGEQLQVVQPPKSAQAKKLLAIPDPALRSLLIAKGVITYDELAAKEEEILGRQRVPESPQASE